MSKKLTIGLLGAASILAAVPMTAFASGKFAADLPTVGGASYCASYIGSPTGQSGTTGTGGGTGAGSVCQSTVPAGPLGLTGSEIFGADVHPQVGGAPPGQVGIPTSMLGGFSSGFINRLIGGDFTTNPNQRLSTTKGIASVASLSPTAAVMTADRWWTIAPAAGVTVTIDSTAATAVVPALNNTKALRLARTSSGAAGNMCIGQTLDAAASQPLIGNNAIFSFWESQGAGMSATSGNFTVNVDYTSAADAAATQATLGFAGANGSLFALGDTGLLSTGPTNMTRAIAGFSSGTTGSLAAGVATIAGSTTWTRYGVYAPIPVNVPGTTTPVTSVSVSVCFAPVATTAISTDWIEIEGAQLEAAPSTAIQALPNGVISPRPFERRSAAIEAAMAYYYWWYNFEDQAAIRTVATCENTATNATNCLLVFPEPMRIAPVVKYTAGFQVFVQVAETSVGACSALAASSTYATVPSTSTALVGCSATTVGAAGTANQLTTLGTSSATGIISASAEP